MQDFFVAARIVAFNGYEEEVKWLSFLSKDFYLERDFLVAGRCIKYGAKRRTRLMNRAHKGDVERVKLFLKINTDVNAVDIHGKSALHYAFSPI